MKKKDRKEIDAMKKSFLPDIANWIGGGARIRLEVTSKIIKGKREYFMARKYENSNIEDETVPLSFHTKNYKKGDPFKLYKEEQKKKKDRKNEEALDKSVEMKDEEDSDN